MEISISEENDRISNFAKEKKLLLRLLKGMRRKEKQHLRYLMLGVDTQVLEFIIITKMKG